MVSTRASVKVSDGRDSFLLYHHCDGYPKGVGLKLYKYIENNKHRWLIDASEIATELVRDYGFDIIGRQPGDVEYTYEIDVSKKYNPNRSDISLKCYAVHIENHGEYSENDLIDLDSELGELKNMTNWK